MKKENRINIEDIFGTTKIKIITNEIMSSRKYVNDDNYSYNTIEKKEGDKIYIIKPLHVSVREVIDMGDSKCNKCYGSGKKIINILKEKISDPNDFLMLANKSMMNLTEEQKEHLIEEEKKNKFWKVLLPCKCAMKKLVKKEDFILSNDMNNIIIKVICEEKTGE